MTKNITTRVYRKSRILENAIASNRDIVWFGVALLFAFFLGAVVVLLAAALFVLLGGDASSIPGGWKSLAAFFVALCVEAWAIVKKLYAPQGEISKSLSMQGNKPLESLDSSGNTILSTDLILPRSSRSLKVEINESRVGANDVIFEDKKAISGAGSGN